jgi:predicted ATPase with chaperone activity
MHIDTYMATYIYRISAYWHIYAMTNPMHFNRVVSRVLSNLISVNPILCFRQHTVNVQVFDKIVGYDGIKRTFLRSLTSKEPVHILLIGPPGQAKTMFLKCILETFGEKKAFFYWCGIPAWSLSRICYKESH